MMDYLETLNDDKNDGSLKNSNIFTSFYENFLNSSQDIQAALKCVDMEKQREVMEESFTFFLKLYKLENVFPEYSELASQHFQMQNVGADMYDRWMSSVQNVVEAGGAKQGSEFIESWKEATSLSTASSVVRARNSEMLEHA